jgi:GNAT superfamily N-acetyltransferase
MTLATAVRIRTGFEPGDISAVAGMHAELYSSAHGFDGATLEAYVAETMAALFREPAGGQLWIAESDGRVVGSIGITRDSPTDARLRWFLIEPEARGAGVGRELIERARAFCRAQRYDRVSLWTVEGLGASAHLYAALGFRPVEERPGAGTWGQPAVEQRWEVDLSGSAAAASTITDRSAGSRSRSDP